MLQLKFSWSDICWSEPQHIEFVIQAVYDVFTSPHNLYTWGNSEAPTIHVPFAPVEEPWSTYCAAAKRPRKKAANAGDMTRYERKRQGTSYQDGEFAAYPQRWDVEALLAARPAEHSQCWATQRLLKDTPDGYGSEEVIRGLVLQGTQVRV